MKIIIKEKLFLFLFSTIFFSFFTCGIDIQDKYMSFQSISYNYQHFINVEFTGSKYLQIDMSGDNLAGKSLYLIKSNDTIYDIYGGNTGRVIALNDINPPSKKIDNFMPKSINSKSINYGENQFYHSFYPAAKFNNNPPPFNRTIKYRNGTVYHYGEDNLSLIEHDTTKDYWVCNNDIWEKQTATLIKKSRYLYVWTSQSVYDDMSITDADNLINNQQIDNFCKIFDGSSDSNYTGGIYKLVSNVFGVEYGGGELGDGGIDSDQHIDILIYDINNNAPSNFGIAGYFWGKDLYDEEHSNKQEMLYLDSYFFDRYPNMIPYVTAHEFQHLIQFNMKFIQKNLTTSEWYNEMCSLISEDLITEQLNINDSTQDTPKKFLPKFNSYYYTNGITHWNNENTMGECSAISYTFGAFLARNYGGASLFNKMLSNDFVDKESINEALSSQGFQKDFDTIFEEFSKTIVLNDTTLDNLTFPHSDSEVNSISYVLGGFNLYSIPQDNTPTQLGPHYFLPEEQVELKSFGISIHTCDEWQNLTDDITILLEAPKQKINFYLVVK